MCFSSARTPVWHTFEDWNYYIDDNPTIYWNDARTVCQDYGGDLVVIRSDGQKRFIWDLIKKHDRQVNGAWIGIFVNSDKKFYWVDQTLVQNGQITASPEVEKCGHIKAAYDNQEGQLNVLRCDAYSNVLKAPIILCQRPIRGNYSIKFLRMYRKCLN